MKFKSFIESENHKHIVYHQTSLENARSIKRRGFSRNKSVYGIIWFTSDLEKLNKKESGAAYQEAILKCEVTITNPAGWKEYHNLLLMQLDHQGYDGVILPDSDEHYDCFVWNPKQIKVLEVII